MKRILFVLLVCVLVAPARGQMETLFGEDVSYGGFGAGVLKLSAINEEPAFFRGFRAGWIINMQGHSIALGGGYYVLENSIPAALERPDDQPLPPLDVSYGGVETEYVYRTTELIHLFVPALIGSGSVTYEFARTGEDAAEVSEDFFVLEPAVGAEVNLFRWLRLSGAVSYRWVDGIEIDGTSEERLSNLTGTVMLKLGWF